MKRSFFVIISILLAVLLCTCVDVPVPAYDNPNDPLSDEFQPTIPNDCYAWISTDSTLSITWTAPDYPVLSFILQLKTESTAEYITVATLSYQQLNTSVWNSNNITYRQYWYNWRAPLSPDSTYYLRIAATTARYRSPFAPFPPAKLLLDPPTSITFNGTNSKAKFTWNITTNVFPVTTIVERKPVGGTYAEIARIPSAVNAFSDSTMDPMISYTYRFTVASKFYAGPHSAEYTIDRSVTSISTLRTFPIATDATDMVFTKDEAQVVIADAGGMITVHNVATGVIVSSFAARSDGGPVYSCALNSDNTMLAAAVASSVNTYLFPSGIPKKIIKSGSPMVGVAGSSAAGSNILATVSNDANEQVVLWDFANGTPITSLPGTIDNPLSVEISPDNNRIAAGSAGMVRTWDLNTHALLSTVNAFPFIPHASFGPSDQISLASEGTVRDVSTDAVLFTYSTVAGEGHYCTGFSPDRLSMVISGNTASWFYDLRTPNKRITLPNSSGQSRRIQFLADGSTIAACSVNGQLRFWQTHSTWSLR